MTRLSPGDSGRVPAFLAREHGCSENCPACAAERENSGVVLDPLKNWETFVSSPSGLRIARHVKRSNGTFPRFSDDPVTQFCIEEALLERLEAERAVSVAQGAPSELPTESEFQRQQAAHETAMREFRGS